MVFFQDDIKSISYTAKHLQAFSQLFPIPKYESALRTGSRQNMQ